MIVRYCVSETLTYSGEIDIDEDTYNDWKDKNDDELGNLILDMIDRDDPQQWDVDSVDEFDPVEEDAQADDDYQKYKSTKYEWQLWRMKYE